jgi:RNA polymerase sigma-70 factor (ECF subfamily)
MRWWRPRSAETLPDAAVVSRVLGGDTDEYAELVRRHQEVLYRHACGMGIDHDTALDLVQDAFVRAFARLSECQDPAHFRAWAFRIMRNLCLDYLKNKRRLSVPFSALADAEDLPALVVDIDMGATLQEALGTLPVALREAFLLKHDAEYTYDEIAELTDASPSAVKMRVHRAREALREFLVSNGVNAA